MIYSIFGLNDTTLYEGASTKNTGLDGVLDLSKGVSSTIVNNRILINFDLSAVSESLVSGLIVSPKYYLNLYTVEAQEVPSSYKVEVYPVSQSWDSGIGKYSNLPISTYNSTWINRKGSANSSTPWTTASFAVNTTGSSTSVSGGGTWYTNYICSQSYDYSSTDIRIEVTSIVNSWLNNTIPNNGFIIKKSTQDEQSTDQFITLKYFSSDTHTIYLPNLEVAWDSAAFTTGSLTQPSTNKDITVYVKNLKKAYKDLSRARLDIGVREKYPVVTYATQSNFLNVNYLPSSSFFYSIQHADTQETVIPFDTTYTKVSCDSNGNFINLWLDGLQPERYYKILFRVDRSGAQEYYDNNHIFKIVK